MSVLERGATTLRTERDPESLAYRSDRTVVQRVAKDQRVIAFSLSSTDRADLVGLLDGTDATPPEMRTALNRRGANGDIRMASACAEALLLWVRARARAGRASSTTVDLERALLFGRVAFAVQRALAKDRSIT
jgi:hypothetical protein